MPRIPTQPLQPLSPGGGFTALSMSGASPAPIADFGRQLQQFGGAVMNAGTQGMEIATAAATEANRVQFLLRQNEARAAANNLTYGAPDTDEKGFLSIKGEAALRPGPDNVPLVERYTNKYRDKLNEIEAGLSNDAQRQAFAVWRAQSEGEFQTQVQRHWSSQYEGVKQSAYKGSMELGQNEAAANWQDPARVRDAIYGVAAVPGDDKTRYGGVREAAYQYAQARGLSATESKFEVQKAVSQAHLGVLAQALDAGDSGYALAYLREHKGDMLGNDVLKVNGTLTQHVDAASAQGAVQQAARSFASKFQPTDMDRLVGVVQQLENGGRGDWADADKKVPLTSKAGARYGMQVMPATAKAPGYGIRPAADESPAEYNRVGRELLGALVKKYGNVAQALSAYNGGAAHVDKAIKDARAGGDESQWLVELRKYKSPANYAENTAYVQKGVKLLGVGDGAPPLPTEGEFVQAALDNLGPGASPGAVRLTQQAASQQYSLITRSIKQRDDQTTADAMRALEANGGRVDLLPLSLRAKIPPKALDDLYNFGSRIAKGDDRTDPAVYQHLSDPANLAKLTENELYQQRRNLSEADFKHFSNEWAKAKGKAAEGAGKPGDLDSAGIKQGLDSRLRMLGIDPTPKDGSDDAGRVGAIRQFVNEQILVAQKGAGKKFNDAELNAHIDRLFAQNTTLRGFFSDKSGPMLGMKAGDIPKDALTNIKAMFKRGGVDNPTDAQVLSAYWNLQTWKK